MDNTVGRFETVQYAIMKRVQDSVERPLSLGSTPACENALAEVEYWMQMYTKLAAALHLVERRLEEGR